MNAHLTTARPGADHHPDPAPPVRAALLAALDAERRQLSELRATAEALRGQSDTDSLLERELAERGATNAGHTIADIEIALSKLDAGRYGLCEQCGGAIAPARLEVIPQARVCVSCPSPDGGR
jgi:RNA polymerase-binding transcription factor DksA